jgi:hypothetical protein
MPAAPGGGAAIAYQNPALAMNTGHMPSTMLTSRRHRLTSQVANGQRGDEAQCDEQRQRVPQRLRGLTSSIITSPSTRSAKPPSQ